MKKPTYIEQASTLKILPPLKARRLVFGNGLKVIFVRNRLSPTFSYQTWYNVGSRDEEKGQTGIAHLFEHMMFKGTKRRKQGEFDQALELAGAQGLNAFTGTDYTAYVQSLPVEAFPLVAGLEAERMTDLVLHKKPFESEREVVHNERKEYSDNYPEGRLYEALMKLSFQKHPYGWPIIGFAEDLNRMTTKDLAQFYKNFYAPNNTTIVIVGDLSEQKVLKTIHKHYGKIPPSKTKESFPDKEEEQSEERNLKLPLHIHVEKAYIGYKIPAANHKDKVPLTLLDTVLTSGNSSRLYKALVDTDLAINVHSWVDSAKDPSLFHIFFSSQANKAAQQAIDVIDREIDALSKKEISTSELSRAINKLHMEFHSRLSTNSSLATFIGQTEIVRGDFTKELGDQEQLSKITKKDVQRVAKTYLQKKRRNIVIGQPKK